MINLLPNPMKKQLKAARANVILLRYTILLGASAIFLGLGIASVYLLMTTIRSNAETAINENQTRITNYTAVETQAAQFRTNLATAKTILDKEVIYSKAMVSIAQALPQGVVLDNLSLDSRTFGTPTTISARTRSYDDALNLKDALEASDAFSDVHFSSISSSGQSGTPQDSYPFSVSINLVIDRGIATR